MRVRSECTVQCDKYASVVRLSRDGDTDDEEQRKVGGDD